MFKQMQTRKTTTTTENQVMYILRYLNMFLSLSLSTRHLPISNSILIYPYVYWIALRRRMINLTMAVMKDDMFDNISKCSKVECPVYIIHAKDDQLVPILHVQVIINHLSRLAVCFLLFYISLF